MRRSNPSTDASNTPRVRQIPVQIIFDENMLKESSPDLTEASFPSDGFTSCSSASSSPVPVPRSRLSFSSSGELLFDTEQEELEEKRSFDRLTWKMYNRITSHRRKMEIKRGRCLSLSPEEPLANPNSLDQPVTEDLIFDMDF